MTEKKKLDIVSKMTIIGIVAAALLIIAASVFAFSMMSEPTSKETIPVTDEQQDTTEEPNGVEQTYERTLAVVKYVDEASKKLLIYDIEKMKMITLKVDRSIEIKDEYGTDIALSQIELGDMIESKYDTLTMVPESVRITAVTWQRKDVSNMVVDTENKQIKIANDVYTYTEELVTSDEGLPFDISDLSTADEAVVRGYKNMVWSIILVNGHGSIKLINHDIFIGGQISIGTRLSFPIEAETVIPIAAGVHNVVITKDNMATIVKEVLIEEDREFVIDLSEAQPKIGRVEFIILQDDVTVFLDNEELDLSEEIILDFGTYVVRAEKANYVTWESELVLEQGYQQFKIDLDKTPTFVFIQAPEGAEAYLDGVLIGIIPTQAPFSPGKHTVQLRQDGFRTSEMYNYLWEDDGQDKFLILPDMIELPAEVIVEPETNDEPVDHTNGDTTSPGGASTNP